MPPPSPAEDALAAAIEAGTASHGFHFCNATDVQVLWGANITDRPTRIARIQRFAHRHGWAVEIGPLLASRFEPIRAVGSAIM